MTGFVRRVLGFLLVSANVLTAPASAARCPMPTVIDHFAFGHLPPGLGTPSDFVYDFEGVDFTARVWESRTADGWQVDLDIDVLRGARLSSAGALHHWFIGYEQRDPTPRYHRVRVHGRPGWLCRDQLFWLVRPGVAISVHLDGQRWSRRQVARTARSAREGDHHGGALADAIVRSSSQAARSETALPRRA